MTVMFTATAAWVLTRRAQHLPVQPPGSVQPARAPRKPAAR